MEELLKHLEEKIKALIDQHQHIKHSNQQMHQGKFQLMHEHQVLVAKQQKAIAQIETLVAKLKAIEKLP